MIERGHVHNLQPFSTHLRPDGLREVQSRCECGGPATPQNPMPGSVLEQKLVFNPATGEPVSITFRFGGVWFDAVELARLAAPVEECPTCGGDAPTVRGTVCGTCRGLRVTVDGEAVQPPLLQVG